MCAADLKNLRNVNSISVKIAKYKVQVIDMKIFGKTEKLTYSSTKYFGNTDNLENNSEIFGLQKMNLMND